jgi:capsid protein
MPKNVVTSTKYAFLQNALQLIVSKVVHDLCIEKQCSFLGMKQRLQELLVEKEHKELEHWQAKLMIDDRRAIHAQVRIFLEKVKDDFDVAQLSMQGFFKNLCLYI